ncbi:MAG: Sua5/YciO/YrdC/YwlC family protein [Hydrogenibacillus sp.]|nr:Sua5/YciO/YrdC/YwlC family protein [Hydrogenibacillus sp.]
MQKTASTTPKTIACRRLPSACSTPAATTDSGDPSPEASSSFGRGKSSPSKASAYHLACDATREAAAFELRRSWRPRKPAVMAASVEGGESAVRLSPEERFWRRHAGADRRRRAPGRRACAVKSPGTRTVGVMLPYTPLHHLLFDAGAPAFGDESANTSGLPDFLSR